ncbi:MAG: PilW family protein [Granulosicoccus sp.]
MTTPLKRASGFSLVELMIAMVLGVVIVGGCISIFSGVVRSSSLNQAVSNLQSNARFALDIIGHDVRAAGFLGCAAERNVGLNVTVNDPPTTDLSRSAVAGFVVTDTVWQPQFPQAYTAPLGVGRPVPGTHALSVHYADFPGLELNESMSVSRDSMELKRREDRRLVDGQLMVVSDCNSADLFSIANVARAADTVTLVSAEPLQKSYALSTVFPGAVRAMPFVSTIYYIGDTQRTTELGDDVYSLYAHSYPYTAQNPPLELIEGVDQLALEFGVRQADGSLLYATADSADYQPEGVETVRVGMLLSSIRRFSEADTSRAYTLAGLTVIADSVTPDSEGAAGGAAQVLTYPNNERLRIPFNATFNVRNRNI